MHQRRKVAGGMGVAGPVTQGRWGHGHLLVFCSCLDGDEFAGAGEEELLGDGSFGKL
jgi:hypothetical protein